MEVPEGVYIDSPLGVNYFVENLVKNFHMYSYVLDVSVEQSFILGKHSGIVYDRYYMKSYEKKIELFKISQTI